MVPKVKNKKGVKFGKNNSNSPRATESPDKKAGTIGYPITLAYS